MGFPGKPDNHVMLVHACFFRRASPFHGDDQDPALSLETQHMSSVRRDLDILPADAQPAPAYPAIPDQPRQDVLGSVDGSSETQPLGAKDNGRRNADNLTARGDQRPARVAGIQGGIRLDHIVDEPAGLGPQGAPETGQKLALLDES